MARATWRGVVLAESDDTVAVEGNHYFPREALVEQHFRSTPQNTICPWKGEAHYLDVVVDGHVNEMAAWTYPEPLPAAESIRARVAFWKGVEVES